MAPSPAAPPPPAPAGVGKVVVAGGSGFLGTHLCGALADAGHEVVVLSRQPRPAAGRVRFVTWTPEISGSWEAALTDAQAVINLCGAGIADRRWSEPRKRTLIDSRVVPSRALIRACQAMTAPPAVLLQASGVGFYGTGETLRDEDAPAGNDFLARLATAWEAPLAEAPTRTVALRFGVVLDRSGGALPRMLLPFRLCMGGPVAGGRQWLSWVHRQDAVDAILFAMRAPLAGPINVTAPNPVRNAEFARIAGAVLHRPARLPLPAFVLQAVLGEQATLICDGQRAVPSRLAGAGFRFRHENLQDALNDLIG
jgi:uncharacterized protein